MIAICIGRFDLSLLEAKRCTPVDFKLYSKAHLIRNEEQVKLTAIQAWLNQSVQATKKSGKKHVPQYKNFNEFYDSEKAFYDIFSPAKEAKKPKRLSLADRNRLLSRRGGN